MAMNVAEAAEMTQVAANKGILALIDHELRFQPGRRRAYEMLREGVIGEIRHGKAFFQAPHRGDPNVAWNWWSDEAVGGGALGAIGSHIIDSFNWFLGTEIKSLSCQLQTHIKQRRDAKGELREVTSDDEANMLLRFADSELTADATVIVSISMTENPIYQNTMEFYGTRGSMRIAHRGEPFIARSGDQDWQEISVDLGRQIPGIPDTGFARAFMEFGPIIVDAILDGQTEIENAATFRDGLETQRVLDAARQSDKSGSAVIIER
jgi:predicted dehydrogenase